ELIGKHFSVLLEPDEVPRVSRKLVLQQYQGKVTGPEKAPKLFDERRRGSRKTVGLEVRLRCKKTGTAEGCTEAERLALVTSYGEVDAAGFFEKDSKEGIKLKGSVGIIHDITQRRQTQEQLELALQEKNLLLKEIHHRVKNNLQIISSLLNMQKRNLKDPEDANLFLDSQMQIRSMALVHEHLYLSEQLSTVNVASYLNNLVQSLAEMYGKSFNNIQIHIDVEEFSLNINTATPLGLLVNELVSNSIKYAFPDSQKGNIWVQLKRGSDKCILTVADDGIGLPENFHLQITETLGYQLIHALVEQLEGKLERLPQKGTAYRIELPF
ncbi:MAG: histidine kinase dimerization/phosphoacceptor domain -containing protein, partial [Spirochaetales bacterium]